MLKSHFILPLAMTALVLGSSTVAQNPAGVTPPPPGPYQSLPAQIQAPQPQPIAQPMAQPAIPRATQLWGQPRGQMLPYWMQAPVQNPTAIDQGGISPDANPMGRGGQVSGSQFSPANETTAPINPAAGTFVQRPFFGTQTAPGYFPGYGIGQATGAQVQMQAGGAASSNAQVRGQAIPQPNNYPVNRGYPAYPSYPAYPAYPAQIPMPYWGAPASPFYPGFQPAYPAPGQVRR